MTFCEYTKYHETSNAFYWESALDTLEILGIESTSAMFPHQIS